MNKKLKSSLLAVSIFAASSMLASQEQDDSARDFIENYFFVSKEWKWMKKAAQYKEGRFLREISVFFVSYSGQIANRFYPTSSPDSKDRVLKMVLKLVASKEDTFLEKEENYLATLCSAMLTGGN